jgi:hypothetical protein
LISLRKKEIVEVDERLREGSDDFPCSDDRNGLEIRESRDSKAREGHWEMKDLLHHVNVGRRVESGEDSGSDKIVKVKERARGDWESSQEVSNSGGDAKTRDEKERLKSKAPSSKKKAAGFLGSFNEEVNSLIYRGRDESPKNRE